MKRPLEKLKLKSSKMEELRKLILNIRYDDAGRGEGIVVVLLGKEGKGKSAPGLALLNCGRRDLFRVLNAITELSISLLHESGVLPKLKTIKFKEIHYSPKKEDVRYIG